MSQTQRVEQEESEFQPPLTRDETLVRMFGRFKGKYVCTDAKGRKIAWGVVPPELATSALYWFGHGHQRRLRMPQVAKLKGVMDDGTYLPNNPLWFCVFVDAKGTKQYVLINGQHSFEALFEHGNPVEVQIVLEPVPDIQTVAAHYAIFDSGAPRTQKDITDMIAAHHPDATKFDGLHVNLSKTSAAMALIHNGLIGGHSSLSKADKVTTLLDSEYTKPIQQFFEITGEMNDKTLERRERDAWKQFHHRFTGPRFISVFAVSLLSRNKKTVDMMKQLIAYAKGTKGLPQYIENLYRAIMSIQGDVINPGGHGGYETAYTLWRTAFNLDAAINKQRVRKHQQNMHNKYYKSKNTMDLFRDTWALASGGLIKPPKIEAIDIDVEATKERHSHAGDGLHIIENNEK